MAQHIGDLFFLCCSGIVQPASKNVEPLNLISFKLDFIQFHSFPWKHSLLLLLLLLFLLLFFSLLRLHAVVCNFGWGWGWYLATASENETRCLIRGRYPHHIRNRKKRMQRQHDCADGCLVYYTFILYSLNRLSGMGSFFFSRRPPFRLDLINRPHVIWWRHLPMIENKYLSFQSDVGECSQTAIKRTRKIKHLLLTSVVYVLGKCASETQHGYKRTCTNKDKTLNHTCAISSRSSTGDIVGTECSNEDWFPISNIKYIIKQKLAFAQSVYLIACANAALPFPHYASEIQVLHFALFVLALCVWHCINQ